MKGENIYNSCISLNFLPVKLLILISLFPLFSFSQTINQIDSREKAEKFIAANFKYYDHKYDSFEISAFDPGYDNFKNGDFDHDGKPDLLAFGVAHFTSDKMKYKQSEIVIIVNDGRRAIKVNFPDRFFIHFGGGVLPDTKVICIGDKDYIEIKYNVRIGEDKSLAACDTIFVMNRQVMLFTSKPQSQAITRLEFKTDHCLGPCPVFEIAIDEHLKVEYNGIEFVDKKDEYRLQIDKQDWEYLVSLLNNIKIQDLNEEYSVRWTDDQTGSLTVFFKGGTKKEIEDYGLRGTFGLSVLYMYLFELRKF